MGLDQMAIYLIHDPKLPSYHSIVADGDVHGYTIVTRNIAGLCQKIVMDPIPSSQHRPIDIQVNAAVRPTMHAVCLSKGASTTGKLTGKGSPTS